MGEPEVKLYAGGEMVGTIYPNHKAQTWMPLENIPRVVVDAVLTAEDRRFWTHPGMDPVAVARAFPVNLKRNVFPAKYSALIKEMCAEGKPAQKSA